jgi:hypothetical protein
VISTGFYIFLSDGWFWRVRPSSSHFTSASVFVRFLNCPEFSGRLSKISQAHNPTSGIQFRVGNSRLGGGLLARPRSAVAPACSKGGCETLRSFGLGLWVRWVMSIVSLNTRWPNCDLPFLR